MELRLPAKETFLAGMMNQVCHSLGALSKEASALTQVLNCWVLVNAAQKM